MRLFWSGVVQGSDVVQESAPGVDMSMCPGRIIVLYSLEEIAVYTCTSSHPNLDFPQKCPTMQSSVEEEHIRKTEQA